MNEYILGDVLGTGQFAKVYRAKHKTSDTSVALKVIKITEENRQDILNEISLHCDLKHDNIVYLHGYFHNIERHKRKMKNTFVFVMEIIEGKELFDVISEGVTVQKARSYFRQITNAIDYLHQHDIIHRDIKPENIMITNNDVLKLTDFGLSKRCKKDDFCDTYCGTTDYLAPEIASERSYNYFVDIWSLGVLLYEMLYGDAPFYSTNKKKIISNIRNVKYTFPHDVDEFAQDLITKILRKKPRERLQIEQILQHPFLMTIDEVDESSMNSNESSNESIKSNESIIAEHT